MGVFTGPRHFKTNYVYVPEAIGLPTDSSMGMGLPHGDVNSGDVDMMEQQWWDLPVIE